MLRASSSSLGQVVFLVRCCRFHGHLGRGRDGDGGTDLGILLPFLIACALKTAQGSSTVAIITTASIVAPLMGSLGLEGELAKAMTVIAIGAGSTMVCHANDSFFWVVTQMSGMDVKRGYSLLSLGSVVLGTSAALLLSLFFKIIG